MRRLTRQDVEEAWQAWAATELATYDRVPSHAALTPIVAARMLAHQRFSSVFCDYVLQNEPGRIVEITRLDVMRAVRERENELEEWREDWEIFADCAVKEEARRQLAQSQRAVMELTCLRHLWLASQAWLRSSDRRPSSDGRDSEAGDGTIGDH
jgi:hypothetical protein